MAPRTTRSTHHNFHQNFFDDDIDPILTRTVHERELTEEHLEPFLNNSLGIAPAYSETDRRLIVLAIANQSEALLVEFSGGKPNRDNKGRILLQDKLFCRSQHDIFAFDFEAIALSLYRDHGLRLVNGVDIQSACCAKTRQPLASIKFAVGNTTTIYEDNVRNQFETMVYDHKRTSEPALRAWLSQYLPRINGMEETFVKAQRIDTQKLPGIVSQLPIAIEV
jgi:regulator of nonsense transcripts 1